MATGSRIESRLEAFRRSSFDVVHKVYKGDQLAIEAFETRVLVGRHPDDPDRLKSAPFPPEIVAHFMQAPPCRKRTKSSAGRA